MSILKKLSIQSWVLIASGLIVVASILAVFIHINTSQVYIEKSSVSAPHVSLSAPMGGVLQEIFVHDGDVVPANTVVARVNNVLIKTKTNAIILSIKNDIGKNFAPGEEIAKVIDPNELRIVAHIEENKGLSEMHVGDNVMFKVDSFGSQKFYGTVELIAPSSRESDLVFSISDKRESKVFDVQIRYNLDTYTALKDGMSAKVWVKK